MAAPHGSRPVPPDRRPYRRTSEPGPDITHEITDQAGRRWRKTFRQVGWHGQSGAFYALDEPAMTHEPGSVAPLYVIAHVDELDAEDEPDTPAKTITINIAPDPAHLVDEIRRLRRGY